jgi:hypothetical protein
MLRELLIGNSVLGFCLDVAIPQRNWVAKFVAFPHLQLRNDFSILTLSLLEHQTLSSYSSSKLTFK